CTRFRFIGVAHQIMGANSRTGDGFPLATGRKRCAAAAKEFGIADLADDTVWSKFCGPSERRIAASGPIGIKTGRINNPNPAKQPECRIASLGKNNWCEPSIDGSVCGVCNFL